MDTPPGQHQRFKIFSDPVHGFVSVPKHLIMDLIQTPEVQRLRRIRQLGVGHLVFPGAEHTRFNHALGATALMQDALKSIADKGTPISQEEYLAAVAAALLHDIGHGPYSHTLEHDLIRSFEHEAMSRVLITHLNERFGGALDLALKIFDGTYERPFFHQLIASQLDMDRLDYLRRDSFYTGVAEGAVGVQRIIKTLRVWPPSGDADANVVVESKSIYAVENFLLSRRLMYWQVYLHKTVLAGDQLLRAAFRRARQHLRRGTARLETGCSRALCFFLKNDIGAGDLAAPEVRDAYCQLDDTDVLFSLKQWMRADDRVLADLCRRFINRDFFRVTFLQAPPSEGQMAAWRRQVAAWLAERGVAPPGEADDAARLYLTQDRSRHSAYERVEDAIGVLDRERHIRELSEMADTGTMAGLMRFEVKPYLCYPKEVALRPDVVSAV